MTESTSYEELREWIRGKHLTHGELAVIDGATGSGKTKLVMRLAKDLGGVRVSLDCYVRAGTDGYFVDRLMSEFLADDIGRFRKLFPLVLVEGICVREALERLGVSWAATIYVKQLATNGLWHFQLHLEDFASGNALREDEVVPFRSDYDYHLRHRPHEAADFIHVRVAD